MKTKQITLRLTVPDWLPGPAYWNRVKVTWRTLKYKFRPCVCTDCKKPLDFRSAEYCYNGDATHRRILLSCSSAKFAKNKNEGLCGDCLAARIRALFARSKPNRGTQSNGLHHTGTKKCKCDGCGDVKATMDVSWDKDCDIRFGSNYWNGHRMCVDCLALAAEKGKQTSGRSMHVSGRKGCIELNQAGAAIGLEHWYELLFPAKKEKK